MSKHMTLLGLRVMKGLLTVQAKYFHWRAEANIKSVAWIGEAMLSGSCCYTRYLEGMWLAHSRRVDMYVDKTASAMGKRAGIDREIMELELKYLWRIHNERLNK